MTKSVLVIAALSGMLSTAAFAGQPTQEETQFCAHDYRQYCNEDGIGSQLLALCMRQHGKELSAQCIKALEDAGEVTPQEEAELEKRGQ
ncbi:hypothetical protein [Methyloceanibacter superfactus]|jgi:hypothetical protein|nr:hypothetical protein [Methyloceanibacter superfactus]